MYEVLKACEESYLKAAKAIKEGKVIVVPTDAVYAVVCDAFNEDAVRRLRQIRQSPENKPLSLIIDVNDIDKFCMINNDDHRKMMKALLPGKVSFLAKKNGSIFESAVPNSDAICVFWQNNETREVYLKAGTVLAISSANKAAQPEATTIEEALAYFKDEVDLFIDSGEERGNKGTTQLDIRENEVKVMRDSPTCPILEINKLLTQNDIDIQIA